MTAFFPHAHRANVANVSKLAAFLGTNHSLALLHVLRDSFGIKRENYAEKDALAMAVGQEIRLWFGKAPALQAGCDFFIVVDLVHDLFGRLAQLL